MLARSCGLIIIGTPGNATGHLAYNRRFVYSLYTVEVLDVLKNSERPTVKRGTSVTVAELGGSIRFPSGHQEFFWEAHDGFMGSNKHHLLFLWRPVRSSDTYMRAEAYMLDEGRVFPVTITFGEAQYSNMPVDAFIARVKKLIRADKDGE